MVSICDYLTYQSVLVSFLSSKESCRICQFSEPRIITDHFLESLQSSNVCSKTNINFFNRKFGIFSTDTYITSRDQINSSSDTESVHGHNHGNSNLFNTAYSFLQRGYQLEESCSDTCRISFLFLTVSRLLDLHGWLQIKTCREMFSITFKHDGSNLRSIAAQIFHHSLQLVKVLKFKRIELLGSIQTDDRNLAILLIFNLDILKLRFF